MPIDGRFATAKVERIKDLAPEKGGVYELKSFGELVYIGKADNLQRRILEHNREKDPNGFRYDTAGIFKSPKKLEDKHLSRYEEKNGKLPPWNTADTRD
jgi:predicted GIY-YIG superfamily endonuclease